MPIIRLLDTQTAALIAAGEVVERPASAAKELIENAIDAGATQIGVEVRRGGVELLRVSDNGRGMERADVPTAFLRHATSKVRTAEDLDAIGTLGFRGEALASIAAVSRVELLTRPAADMAGTRYRLEGGEEVGDPAPEDVGCPAGTDIYVRDMFYNVPARMKFLKTDGGEGLAVAAVVERLALSHPEVGFRFTREGKQELQTPGDGKLHSAVYAVLGREFAGALLPVEYALEGVVAHGFVTRPAAARGNRGMQFFFVNGRFVKTRTAMAAVEQAFRGKLTGGRFPGCVLHIDLPPELVDANVHPAKIEVRFVSEKTVFGAVYHGVMSALNASGLAVDTAAVSEMGGSRAPAPLPPQPMAERQYTLRDPGADAVSRPLPPPPTEPFVGDGFTRPVQRVSPPPDTRAEVAPYLQLLEQTRRVAPPEPAPTPQPEPPPAPLDVHLLGEAFGTYVLAQAGEALYLIDKHAAHERILYNELQRREHTEPQLLLAPLRVPLGREEYAALAAELPALREAGFEAEEFGDALLVRSCPMMLEEGDIPPVLQQIAGELLAGRQGVRVGRVEAILHSVACRAAVKAGDRSAPAELLQLAQRVLGDPAVRYCPCGQ